MTAASIALFEPEELDLGLDSVEDVKAHGCDGFSFFCLDFGWWVGLVCAMPAFGLLWRGQKRECFVCGTSMMMRLSGN